MRPTARWLAFLLLIAAMLLAACGGGSHPNHHKQRQSQKTVNSACPPDRSYMGCTAKAKPNSFLVAPRKLTAAPAGPLVPDVSIWQHIVNWPAVALWQHQRGWKAAAIFKLGEYTLDPELDRNASETSRLGFWRAGYWYVRPTGCAHESAQILSTAQHYGLRVVILDEEAPGIAGYAGCLSEPLEDHGLIVLLYTSPGAWPGGDTAGLSIWIAAYGPQHAPCFVTCLVGDISRQSILAWQFTDGTYGPVQDIPGIGKDDVSVDYGITKLGVPPPSDPYHYAVLTPSERTLTLRYDGARRHAQYAAYTKNVLEPELAKLAHAIWVVHQTDHHPWDYRHRGTRFQVLWRRSLGQLIVPK